MISIIKAAALWGIEAFEVLIEVDCRDGMPGFTLVGLPDSAVRESRDRVSAALKNFGYQIYNKRTTINMAPADVKKEGSSFDLPLAVGMLISSEQVPYIELDKTLILGELSLCGDVKRIKGALSIAIFAKKQGFKSMILPRTSAAEAAIIDGVDVYGVGNVKECIEVLGGERDAYKVETSRDDLHPSKEYALDFSDVKGQEVTRRALEIAASGAHNFLLIGSPGTGKSMCARRISSILPNMTKEEAIETTTIHSGAGLFKGFESLIVERPFRSPHHTVSNTSLVGGGAYPRPGEVSLAHNGLLFLDELPEFSKPVLEVLRQPLEDNVVTISRTAMTVTYPSRFMLGAAMNPCPCGYYGDPIQPCTCSENEVIRYMNKISGPLLDRIDIHVSVGSLNYQEMSDKKEGETSASIRTRVQKAREIQGDRFVNVPGVFCNAHMQGRLIRIHCVLGADAQEILKMATVKMGFSARAYDRILKVARTIADLAESKMIEANHLSEALQYRSLDRKYSQVMF
ncbi:MAG: YifB family Mg chelatase-like AAA ATPase [Fibrobacterales bacterium]